MDQSPAIKIAVALATLVTLWIAVYWLWEPSRSASPSISFAREPGQAAPHGTAANPSPTGDDRRDISSAAARGSSGDHPDVRSPNPDSLDAPAGEGSVMTPGVSADRTAGTGPSHAPVKQPAGESGPLVVKPPKFEEYRVQAGETFETIAAKRYGHRSMASAIARANPFVDPRRLRAGRVILLPVDPTNIQGRVEPSRRTAAEGWKTHTVRSGETLSGISRTHYGTTALSRHIFEANSDRLKNENQLKIGMELLIPPRPAPEKQGEPPASEGSAR
ncbi:MAG: LysM peptidoglycan-binding domain-containing protein [Phycisphaeraceae bacterium]|nr:LysM peptidoglycan-binding domain-containing protein [Phycisphaerae bacterium]MBX3391725.1 LysM peptidoglycan-binding domain-containing protein [Phycisphaeraceae bacterium]